MVNVSNSFIAHMKKSFKSRGILPSDYVICFLIKDLAGSAELEIVVTPLKDFESIDKAPFNASYLIRRLGCWIACDTGASFGLVNSKISIKNNQIVITRPPLNGKNTISKFLSRCLKEYMKVEKLSKEELAGNIRVSLSKFNRMLKGDASAFAIDNMCALTIEMMGKNKIREYSVFIEKYKKNKFSNLDD